MRRGGIAAFSLLFLGLALVATPEVAHATKIYHSPGCLPHAVREHLEKLFPGAPSLERVPEPLEVLGLAESGAFLRRQGEGAFNIAYSLHSRDPGHPIVFPDLPEIPQELRGHPIDGFIAKQAGTKVNAIVDRRDQSVHQAIQKEFAYTPVTLLQRVYAWLKMKLRGPDYEGLHVTETHFLGGEGRNRLIVQRRAKGEPLHDVIAPFMAELMGKHYNRETEGILFARILGGSSWKDSAIGSPKAFMKMFPRLVTDEDHANRLFTIWNNTRFKRLRVLLKRLQRLESSKAIAVANAQYIEETHGGRIGNRLPWMTKSQPVYGDFSHKNFLVYEDEHGVLQLEIFDF